MEVLKQENLIGPIFSWRESAATAGGRLLLTVLRLAFQASLEFCFAKLTRALHTSFALRFPNDHRETLQGVLICYGNNIVR
jgi:hypothetical protein